MTSIGLRIGICSYVGGACGKAETCRKDGRNSARAWWNFIAHGSGLKDLADVFARISESPAPPSMRSIMDQTFWRRYDRYREPMKWNCFSCGETRAPESGEHVFSKWLLKHLQALRTPITHFRYQLDGGSTPHGGQILLNSFKLRRICEPCNNGWMSRLENNAKPVIVGLMDGSLKPDTLDDEQRRLLGRWAGKTALVESYAVGAEKPIDPQILYAMRQYEDGDPGKFGVLAHTADYNAIGHCFADDKAAGTP